MKSALYGGEFMYWDLSRALGKKDEPQWPPAVSTEVPGGFQHGPYALPYVPVGGYDVSDQTSVFFLSSAHLDSRYSLALWLTGMLIPRIVLKCLITSRFQSSISAAVGFVTSENGFTE